MKIAKYFAVLVAVVLSLTLILYPVCTSPEPTATTNVTGEGGRAVFLDWQDEMEDDASAVVNQETEVFATLPEAVKSEADASDSVEDVDAE